MFSTHRLNMQSQIKVKIDAPLHFNDWTFTYSKSTVKTVNFHFRNWTLVHDCFKSLAFQVKLENLLENNYLSQLSSIPPRIHSQNSLKQAWVVLLTWYVIFIETLVALPRNLSASSFVICILK